jgi:hypothetical protein
LPLIFFLRVYPVLSAFSSFHVGISFEGCGALSIRAECLWRIPLMNILARGYCCVGGQHQDAAGLHQDELAADRQAHNDHHADQVHVQEQRCVCVLVRNHLYASYKIHSNDADGALLFPRGPASANRISAGKAAAKYETDG